MSDVLVNRIYNVEVNGIQDAQKQVTAFNNTIVKLDAAFVAAKQKLQQKIDLGASESEIKNLNETVASLQIQLEKLNKQKDSSAKEDRRASCRERVSSPV